MAKKYTRLSFVLKHLLFKNNMKAVDLARQLNLSQPTIHRLIVGKSTRPYKSSLEPIAKYFSISVEQLIGEEPIFADWENKRNDNLSTEELNIKIVPLIEWNKHAVLEDVRKTAKKYIPVIGNLSEKSFALLMSDHSMEPLFPKKAILIFDPYKKPTDRSFVLVKLEGKETLIFRQLLIDIDQQYLKPLNPDLNSFKMKILNKSDEIIACLFESRNNYCTDDKDDIQEVINES